MSDANIAAIILAAGLGTRMKSRKPKVMHPLAGRPMILHLLDRVQALQPQKIAIVVGPEMETLEQAVAPCSTVTQTDRLGTGHAVLQARDVLEDFTQGTVLILFGDTPLISERTLREMTERRQDPDDPAIVVLGFFPETANQYGRLVIEDEALVRIVEYKDATEEEKEIPVCNSGVMAVDAKILATLLGTLKNDNAKGEYYLTDIVAAANAMGRKCVVAFGDEEELLGINSRFELAMAEQIIQNNLRMEALAGGATLTEPASVTFCWDTKIGQDVTIGPNVAFGPGVTIEDDVEIRAFCHIEGAHIAKSATVGPFARLRPGAEIGEEAHIGNFVEVKKSTIGRGAKANHLSYIGDATIGAGSNIGAGVITCNYDGFDKHKTQVGEGAFVGSNVSLVAPVSIGAGAIVGAGSVIAKNVKGDAMALERSSQQEFASWAKKFRKRKKAEKAKRT